MAKLLQLRRGTTTQHGSFTGAEGEVTIDTTKDTAVIHDGSQAGGRPLLREDMANLPAGTIDNADVNASAAIAGTKIAPDFGSQTITTTGKVLFANVYTNESDLPSASTYHGMFAHVHSTGLAYFAHNGSWTKLAKLNSPVFTGGINVNGNIDANANLSMGNTLTLSGVDPVIHLTDTNSNSDYSIYGNGGSFTISDTTNTADRFEILSDGTTNVNGNLNVSSGVDVTGDITTTANIVINSSGPTIRLNDTGQNPDYDILNTDGVFQVNDITNSAIRFRINTDGHVDVTGNLDVGAGLDVTGDLTCTGTIGKDGTDYIEFTDNTRLDIFLNNSNEFRFENDGDFHADGDLIAFSTTTASDRRLKENIEVIPNALAKVEALNGVSFDWKKTGEKSAGVIAQEVQEVLPEAVKEVTPVGGGDSHLTVNYHALTSILIESIKELKAEIEQLKGGE